MGSNTAELNASLAGLHARVADMLSAHETAMLQAAMVTDQWNVLDAIGHINGWGLLFLNDARYMVKNPGKPFPYQIVSSTNFDAENEALVVRRRGWTAAEHLEENRGLSETITQLIDSFAGEPPNAPVVVPTSASTRPMSITDLLRFHVRHGDEHLIDIERALAK